MFGGSSRPGAYQSFGFGATTDGSTSRRSPAAPATFKLTEAYVSVARSTTTGIRTGRAACSAAIRPCDIMAPSVTSRAQGPVLCVYATSTGAKSADYSCNPDFNIAQLGFVTRWTPVKNLTFSGEVLWVHLDQKFTGAATLAASAPKPTTVYEYRDQDAVSLQLRVQRNF